MGAGRPDILVNAGQEPMPARCGLSVRQESGGANGTQAAVCVFNRTQESFLCLRAFAAGALQIPQMDSMELAGLSPLVPEDGLWLLPSDVQFTTETLFPVDLFHVDPAVPFQSAGSENTHDLFVQHADGRRVAHLRSGGTEEPVVGVLARRKERNPCSNGSWAGYPAG
jgi:hypothetical protein